MSFIKVQKWRQIELALRGWRILPLEVRGCLVEANQSAVVAILLLGSGVLRVVNLHTVIVKEVLVEVCGLAPTMAEHTLHPSCTLDHLLAHSKLGLL